MGNRRAVERTSTQRSAMPRRQVARASGSGWRSGVPLRAPVAHRTASMAAGTESAAGTCLPTHTTNAHHVGWRQTSPAAGLAIRRRSAATCRAVPAGRTGSGPLRRRASSAAGGERSSDR